MALAEIGLGLNGIGRNGSWPKWLLAKLGIGPSGAGRNGIVRNGFGRSGNRPKYWTQQKIQELKKNN